MLDFTNVDDFGKYVHALIDQMKEAGLDIDRDRVVSLTLTIEGGEESTCTLELR